MCGITGYISKNHDASIDPTPLVEMMEALTHRGPDDSGAANFPEAAFGFQRLSILDHATGNQPIYNEDGSVVIVCNGEIFNFRELRRQLRSRGHQFSTKGDIEVLVHLYEEHRRDKNFGTFLNQLQGQFAFALYDIREKRVLLARDHVGIAPLFYADTGPLLLFGSEIKALLKHPECPRQVSATGLDQLVTFPGVISPETMFKDIKSIAPGHFALLEQGALSHHCYWDMDYPLESEIDTTANKEQLLEQLNEALTAAVKDRLIADVPVGYYLSGGIDSSLIASLIHELTPKHHRTAFSIGFPDRNIDESYYQDIMVKHLGATLVRSQFSWDGIEAELERAVFLAETPLKETYNICSMALSKSVRDTGLKVVLSGEGADELFAGYVGYRLDNDIRSSQESGWDASAALEAELREKLWGDADFCYERHLMELQDTKQALYSESLNSDFESFDCTALNLVDKGQLQGRHRLHKRSYLDFKLRIADHLLADHGDRVGFGNSVEMRYPFLDTRVIKAAQRIPPSLLIKDGIEKFILKEYAASKLPAAIVQREKFSFVAPGSCYLLKHCRDWVCDLLSYERIERQGYFNPETVQRLISMYSADDFTINQTFDNDLLMIVLTFSIFLDKFNMPAL